MKRILLFALGAITLAACLSPIEVVGEQEFDPTCPPDLTPGALWSRTQSVDNCATQLITALCPNGTTTYSYCAPADDTKSVAQCQRIYKQWCAVCGIAP